MTAMNDDDLARLLEELPRHEASTEFTGRVLDAIEMRSPRKPSRYSVVALGAAAVLLAGAFGLHTFLQEREEQRRAEQRLEEMRREYRALRMELDQLRTLTSEVEPVLDLGGTDQVEFIFDLRELADSRSESRAEPAAHSPR